MNLVHANWCDRFDGRSCNCDSKKEAKEIMRKKAIELVELQHKSKVILMEMSKLIDFIGK